MVTVALAGSVFFAVGLDAARSRTTLYLLLTMAPFAIVSPLVGPLIDRTRGGRRVMLIATTAGRVVVALAMARHVDSLLLFPEAFLRWSSARRTTSRRPRWSPRSSATAASWSAPTPGSC